MFDVQSRNADVRILVTNGLWITILESHESFELTINAHLSPWWPF